MQITTIGLDLAKSVFQVHGVDADGRACLAEAAPRGDADVLRSCRACLVGIEACATAHHWARQITALGHEVRLMPPAYVKAYVNAAEERRGRRRGDLRGGEPPDHALRAGQDRRTAGVLVLHRTRELLVRQRTMLINAIRGHCAEFGMIAPQGAHGWPNCCFAHG